MTSASARDGEGWIGGMYPRRFRRAGTLSGFPCWAFALALLCGPVLFGGERVGGERVGGELLGTASIEGEAPERAAPTGSSAEPASPEPDTRSEPQPTPSTSGGGAAAPDAAAPAGGNRASPGEEAASPDEKSTAPDEKTAAPDEKTTGAAPAKWEFDPTQLEGEDENLGNLAAIRLLEAAGPGDPASAALRLRHREYVMARLQPAAVTATSEDPAALRATRRILTSLGTMIASGGPPFPEATNGLLSLIGEGPGVIRSAVMGAVESILRREREGLGEQGPGKYPAREELCRRIEHNPPPKPGFLRDASRVLWRSDAKRFLESAFSALERNREKYPESTQLYLREVRERLGIDFASASDWSQWWSRQREKPLADIFRACQERVAQESANAWRRCARRLLETADAERLLDAVGETIESATSPELRLAAVETLAELSTWIRTARLTVRDSSGAPVASADANAIQALRDRLEERTHGLLLGILRGESFARERGRVERAALVALRRQRAFLERRKDLLEPLSAILLARLEAIVADGRFVDGGESREDVLELVRTAGALGLTDSREAIESLLDRPAGHLDLELLTASVTSIGRLVKDRLTLSTAQLLIRTFQAELDASAERLRELRLACVGSLNALPAEEPVRDLVQGFFLEIITRGQEREFRIPAILGLGTLAQGKAPGALDALVSVVARPQRFETAEIVAALDAVAYVGGRDALEPFLGLLAARDDLVAKDRAAFDHLWRKVVGLARSDGASGLTWTVSRLQEIGVERDSVEYLEFVSRLTAEDSFSPWLSTEKLDLGDEDRLRCLWVVALARSRAADLLGRDADAAEEDVQRLRALASQNPQIREAVPTDVSVLEKHAEIRSRRASITATITKPGAFDASQVAAAMDSLVRAEIDAVGRWCELRWIERALASEDLRRRDPKRTLARHWLARLEGAEGAGLLSGLPVAFTKAYPARIASLGAPAEPPVDPPPPPPATEGGG